VAVGNAVRSGRLVRSVNAEGKITDPELADREWSANTDYTEAPAAVAVQAGARYDAPRVAPPLEVVAVVGPDTGAPPPSASDGMTMAEAQRVERVWKAKQAELDYREAAGDLVPAADVDIRLRNAFHACKTKLLGIPNRLKTALGLDDSQSLEVERLVREALEELADGGTR
jgi:hypothetical protein